MKAAIAVENLSKRYRLGAGTREQYRTLRESVSQSVSSAWRHVRSRAPWSRPAATAPTHWALKDVSFEIQPGEVVGIIGPNGAGKSTLLKIISRITEPTAGAVKFRGRLSSLLEVGTGFHPELTGRENIFLNAAILGMKRAEILRKFDEIVAFAEMEPFIDTPVKRYSSGMQVRLAFAVSAHLDPDILLIDEVLAVGDLRFQRKCMDYAKGLRQRGATVLLVSHNMFAIKAICGRAIFLCRGRPGFDGPPEEAIGLYEKESRLGTLPWAQKMLGRQPSEGPIHIKDVELLDEAGRPRSVYEHGERMRVRLHFEARQPLENPSFVLSFIRSDDVACCNYNTALDRFTVPPFRGAGILELLTPPLKLVAELYQLNVLVWDAAFQNLYCAQMGSTFHVRHDVLSTQFGVFHEAGEWHLKS